MSNTASSLQSSQFKQVPILLNDELVMLEKSTLNALKVMAYDQGATVEQIIIDAMRETMANPARWASVTDRAKADSAEIHH